MQELSQAPVAVITSVRRKARLIKKNIGIRLKFDYI